MMVLAMRAAITLGGLYAFAVQVLGYRGVGSP